MLVYVARYEHKHGSDIYVFQNKENAEKWRNSIAQEWWESELDTPMPQAEPPNVIADLYFDALNDREWFEIEEQELQ